MFLTEEEARKKWCPFARTASYEPAITNRNMHGEPLNNSCCIASKCMAWRKMRVQDWAGYCGLAGKGE